MQHGRRSIFASLVAARCEAKDARLQSCCGGGGGRIMLPVQVLVEKIAVLIGLKFARNAFGTCLDSIARNSNKMVEILCDLSKIYSKPM